MEQLDWRKSSYWIMALCYWDGPLWVWLWNVAFWDMICLCCLNPQDLFALQISSLMCLSSLLAAWHAKIWTVHFQTPKATWGWSEFLWLYFPACNIEVESLKKRKSSSCLEPHKEGKSISIKLTLAAFMRRGCGLGVEGLLCRQEVPHTAIKRPQVGKVFAWKPPKLLWSRAGILN